MYRKHTKRALDIICSLLALIVFSWLYLIIAILVRIKLGKPVIFRQQRPGRDERIFTLCKFRTMTDALDKNGEPLPDGERLTKFGKWLRSFSLDELPEAWNILKGDMSIVGPRPLLVEYLPLYNDEQKQRHNVRPGLTGHAQVSGRNAVTWQRRFELDCWYVENYSFLVDARIICKTITNVFKRDGISSATSATMEPFMGDG